MKIFNARNPFLIFFLFISANAFPITADELYKWLNNKPEGKVINISMSSASIVMEPNPTDTANASLKFYQRFVGTLSPSELSIKKGTGAYFDGVYLPDRENQCTWIDATQDSHSIVISGRFTGCTFGLCTGKNNHIYAAHIFNNRPKTDQNLEAKNFKSDCGGGGTSSPVLGFKTEKILKYGVEDFGYVIGTFVGGWKWKWVTISLKDRKTIISCKDIPVKDWAFFPLPEGEK